MKQLLNMFVNLAIIHKFGRMKKIIVSIFLIGFFVSCTNETNNTLGSIEGASDNNTSLESEKGISVSGIKLPLQLSRYGEVRNYVGAGTRVKFFMHIYVLGLYMQEPSKDPDVILNSDQPMSVRMQVISSLLTTEVMVKYIREGFDRSAGENGTTFQNEVDLICNTFSALDSYKVGDKIDIQYTPGIGITASINGVPYDWTLGVKSKEEADKLLYFDEDGTAAVPGLGFKKAIFGIWLSDDPVDPLLKDEILAE